MANDNDQNRLLKPLEAALYLGITRELLFQYTKPKFASESRLRKLETIEFGGVTCFSASELDKFDTLLAGEWPSDDGRRPRVPRAIQDHLRAESFNQCARCGKGIGVETAHIKSWAESRSHHPANLIRICSSCHVEHDRHKSLPTSELQALKEKLVERTKSKLLMSLHEPSIASRYPGAISQFVGRENEQTLLVNSLRSKRSVMITGVGGIGKTELLAQAIDAAECARRVIWIDFEKHRSSSDALAALRAALGGSQEACPEDKVIARLDFLEACVVFDGVDRTILEEIDAFEDALSALLRSTSRAQFVVTSQFTLLGFFADTRIELGPLSKTESLELLESYQPVEQSARTDDCSSLLEFCEGHVLTIRLAASLRTYYGSADTALNVLDTEGISKLRLPTRRTQNPRTSLDLCLQAAYNALSCDAQEVLLTFSEAPSGFFRHYLEKGFLGFENPVETISELRRWHLIEFTEIHERLVRVHVLSPIRAFTIAIALKGGRSQYERILNRLAEAYQMMVATLESKLSDPNTIPYVYSRYQNELPNFLRILEVSRENRNNVELGQSAISIIRPLIGYFFRRRLPEQGARVMHDAAELAIWIGKPERASGLILQFVSMADQARDKKMSRAGLVLVEKIEESSEDVEARADMSMCRCFFARQKGDNYCAERHARAAYKGYSHCLREVRAKQSEVNLEKGKLDLCIDGLHNDISQALGLLGSTLLEQNKYEKAQTVYKQSLKHQRGTSIGMNRGQTLHQLGKCASHLGRPERAAIFYLEAADIFHFIEMEQYLSNAVSGLGYALIDVNDEFPLDVVDLQVLSAALSDLSRDIRRVFTTSQSIDRCRAVNIVRKTFGCIATASLSKNCDLLGTLCVQLDKDIFSPINAQIIQAERDADEKSPLIMMETALRLGICAADAENSYKKVGDISHDVINRMLQIVCNSDRWTREILPITDWLSALLSNRWQFQRVSRDQLNEIVWNFQGGVEDRLDLSR